MFKKSAPQGHRSPKPNPLCLGMGEAQPVIQNVADPWRIGRIGKVFQLTEPRFWRDMERDFRI